MQIKILLLAFLFSSCGPQVQLKANKLEDRSVLKEAVQKQATFTSGTPATLQYEGTTYQMSIYSSKQAQDFAAAKAGGGSVQVLFTGGFVKNDVVIETIKQQ